MGRCDSPARGMRNKSRELEVLTFRVLSETFIVLTSFFENFYDAILNRRSLHKNSTSYFFKISQKDDLGQSHSIL